MKLVIKIKNERDFGTVNEVGLHRLITDPETVDSDLIDIFETAEKDLFETVFIYSDLFEYYNDDRLNLQSIIRSLFSVDAIGPVDGFRYSSDFIVYIGEKPKRLHSLKYVKRDNVYTNRKNNEIDLDNMRAYSYGWWRYVDRVNGLIVFNNYNYSSSTSKHQSNMSSLLRSLGIDVDLTVNCRNSLQDLVGCLLEYEYNTIKECEQILKKGTRRGSNIGRFKLVRQHLETIEELKKLLDREQKKDYKAKAKPELKSAIKAAKAKIDSYGDSYSVKAKKERSDKTVKKEILRLAVVNG